MGIVAALIVKNEAKTIGRCLASVAGLIDRYVIIDTGSTDDTSVAIRKATEEHGLKGVIRTSEWVDFGHNRTELVELASRISQPEDWLLVLDADMTVEFSPYFKPPTHGDCGMVQLTDGEFRYWLPLLLRVGKPWVYKMPTHEYLACEDEFERFDVTGLTVNHHCDGISRSNKHERDAELLLRELEENPDNARAAFYLAETWRGMGERDKAVHMYERRVGQEGFWEEAWYSMWRRGELLLERDWSLGVSALLEAYERNPVRAEPLHTLAWAYRLKGNPYTAALFAAKAAALEEPSGLFVQHDVYSHLAEYELGIALQQIGDHKGAKTINHALLASTIPDWTRDQISQNMELMSA